ncbi:MULTISPECIES: hypothetical protein [Marinobacter]|uniref:Uncharacterized protein n=1 Tax=Marinobacter suaedae TaxID=3057675 RepID=A0ABT8VYC8_9GAMM|nr:MULTISPECIES: hypothetical protein [unclassified Marinobacter]MBZ2169129.1 hypothetical protein [Marinobacter sp. F4216]MDO3720999.1 hypothetical protein [Marinobacter sp. chi1]
MGAKPDIIKAIVLIFAVGLVISGFTSIEFSEKASTAQAGLGPVTLQSVEDRLNR